MLDAAPRRVVAGHARCDDEPARLAGFVAVSGDGGRRYELVGPSVVDGADAGPVVDAGEGVILGFVGPAAAEDRARVVRSADAGRSFEVTRLALPGRPRGVRVRGPTVEVLLVDDGDAAEGGLDARTWTIVSPDRGATWSQASRASADAAWTRDATVTWSDVGRSATVCTAFPSIAGSSAAGRLIGPRRSRGSRSHAMFPGLRLPR